VKATFGSVPCACVLVSPLYYTPSVKAVRCALSTDSVRNISLNRVNPRKTRSAPFRSAYRRNVTFRIGSHSGCANQDKIQIKEATRRYREHFKVCCICGCGRRSIVYDSMRAFSLSPSAQTNAPGYIGCGLGASIQHA